MILSELSVYNSNANLYFFEQHYIWYTANKFNLANTLEADEIDEEIKYVINQIENKQNIIDYL